MSTETIKLRAWQVGGTAAALLLSSTPKDKNREGKQAWFPRSQIEHVTRQAQRVGEWQEVVVTLPLWLAEAKGFA
jgi:hypothetical protein